MLGLAQRLHVRRRNQATLELVELDVGLSSLRNLVRSARLGEGEGLTRLQAPLDLVRTERAVVTFDRFVGFRWL